MITKINNESKHFCYKLLSALMFSLYEVDAKMTS